MSKPQTTKNLVIEREEKGIYPPDFPDVDYDKRSEKLDEEVKDEDSQEAF